MSAPLNNQNARKPKKEAASSELKTRCKLTDRREWSRAAKGPLAPWVIRTLNRAAARALANR